MSDPTLIGLIVEASSQPESLASKPPPAWEIERIDGHILARMEFDNGRFAIFIRSTPDGRWGAAVEVADRIIPAERRYPTAPAAARAAVSELRRVLDEARAQLDAVPELEVKP